VALDAQTLQGVIVVDCPTEGVMVDLRLAYARKRGDARLRVAHRDAQGSGACEVGLAEHCESFLHDKIPLRAGRNEIVVSAIGCTPDFAASADDFTFNVVELSARELPGDLIASIGAPTAR